MKDYYAEFLKEKLNKSVESESHNEHNAEKKSENISETKVTMVTMDGNLSIVTIVTEQTGTKQQNFSKSLVPQPAIENTLDPEYEKRRVILLRHGGWTNASLF